MHSQKGTTCEILLPNKQSMNVPQTMQTPHESEFLETLSYRSPTLNGKGGHRMPQSSHGCGRDIWKDGFQGSGGSWRAGWVVLRIKLWDLSSTLSKFDTWTTTWIPSFSFMIFKLPSLGTIGDQYRYAKRELAMVLQGAILRSPNWETEHFVRHVVFVTLWCLWLGRGVGGSMYCYALQHISSMFGDWQRSPDENIIPVATLYVSACMAWQSC